MNYKKQAELFITNSPYRNGEYGGRNWGNPWHSLCSYHGKLKPSIAHFLIEKFTKEGDIVLDPLCGIGTIPFEACLQGRVGIGNDLSELAYIVTKAKVGAPLLSDVLFEYNIFKNHIENHKESYTGNEYQTFGFNGKIPSYFHPDTYKEILAGRSYLIEKLNNLSAAQAMVFSAFLHVLHGNRPYALSRNSHPLTPYAPTGEYIYKNVAEKVLGKININYKKYDPTPLTLGESILGDYNDLQLDSKASAIICSPPFADSFRFYIQNWMRLWLCGWEPEDFKHAENIFLDNKQEKNFDIYKSFFKKCYEALDDNGKVILHLGKTKSVDMAHELSVRSNKYFDIIYSGSEDVSSIENHGISDKGATIEHQFLFLRKKASE